MDEISKSTKRSNGQIQSAMLLTLFLNCFTFRVLCLNDPLNRGFAPRSHRRHSLQTATIGSGLYSLLKQYILASLCSRWRVKETHWSWKIVLVDVQYLHLLLVSICIVDTWLIVNSHNLAFWSSKEWICGANSDIRLILPSQNMILGAILRAVTS